MSGTGPDVFVSFSPPDARLGAAVCQYLAAAGLGVVRAPVREPGPVPWLAQVARQVARCRKLVLLLTDRTPAGWAQAEIAFAQRQLDQEVVPLVRHGAAAQLPGSMVPLHLSDDPAQLQATLATLAQRIRQPRQPPPIIETSGRPFPGLRPFGLHDGRWFFGRDRAVAEATRDLDVRGVRWLRIEGTQGIGKTSFVRAGVGGAVLRGACGGPDDWLVVALRPGAAPLTALREAIERALDGRLGRAAVDAFLDEPAGLGGLLRDGLAGAGLLLIVDHFDDLAAVSAADAAEVKRFGALIGRALADAAVPLLLVSAGTTAQSRRTLDLLPKLTESVPISTVYTLGGLAPAEIERVIVGPLQLSGVRWPEPLLQRLLADATRIAGTPGPLAWMLARLHRERSPSLEAYTQIGGLQYGPGRALDARLDVMSGERRDRTISLILALIQAGRGQSDGLAALAPADAETIAGGGAEGRALLKGLSHGAAGAPDPLLLADPHDAWYRLAHSELLRIWPRLRGLVVTYRAVIERRADIERAAGAWAARGRDPAELPGEARLAQHVGADLPPADRERLRAILSTTARAWIGAAEETAQARRTAQAAMDADAARQQAAQQAALTDRVATHTRRTRRIGLGAAGAGALLLGLLLSARHDASEARRLLEKTRSNQAATTNALAERTSAAKTLDRTRQALDVEKAGIERALERTRTTARLAADEAEALLRHLEDLGAELDGRLPATLRSAVLGWQIERLTRSLEALPQNDRVRLLLAHTQRRLAAVASPKVAPGLLDAALKTLAVLTRRELPAPAALVAEAQVLDAKVARLAEAGAARGDDAKQARIDTAALAVAAWRRAAQLYPSAPLHQAGLSRALAAQGAALAHAGQDATEILRAAAREAERLAAAAPGDFDRAYAVAEALFAWAQALADAGRIAEAKAALTQVLDRLRAAEALATDPAKGPVGRAQRRARNLLGRLSQ